MSTLDQSVLVANVNYHVGHQVAIRVAEERGFFHEEGFTKYKYECSGVLPAPLESRGLALAIEERGVDIAPAADLNSAILARSRGEDLHIVGGWRYTPYQKWYGAKGLTDLRQLRGKRIGTREAGGFVRAELDSVMRDAGLDPETDIEWVYDPVFGYRNNPRHLDMLRTGRVEAVASSPPLSNQLEVEGYPVLLDPLTIFPGGRPGKVTVAPSRTTEQRADELRAYFRSVIRAFWFMRDVDNFEYLCDLEARLRKESHNDEERHLRIVSDVEKLESWALPIDGGISREALERVIKEMVAGRELNQPIHVDEVIRDGAVRAAYKELNGRRELQPALYKVQKLVEKYGF